MRRRAGSDDDREPLLEMSKAEVDPYYSVRDHVQSQVDRIKLKYQKFQNLLETDTSSNSEFKDTRKGLSKDLKSVEKEIKGLRDALDTVDKNRAKFSNLKDSDVAARRQFVNEMQNIVSEIKAGMDSPAVRRKLDADDAKTRRSGNYEVHNAMQRAIDEDNDRFVGNQHKQSRQMISQQDESLEQLGSAVDRLHMAGKEINREVKEQNIMLDELGNEIDSAGGRMQQVQDALGKLLKTKDGCQIWTIVILTLVLLILVALVIWT